MLLLQSDLKNFTLRAKDGEIGRSRDFLFDDAQWVVRYMEVNTGKWLLGRRVLISPIVLGEPQTSAGEIPVQLTREQIENAPGIEQDEPISDRFERAYYGYFGYPYYWVGGDVWGLHGYPADLMQQAAYQQNTLKPEEEEAIKESHLRSMHEVKGYSIHAVDGEIGHVEDFVIDSSNWAVRYLLVDIRRWLPGPSVLMSPQWIDQVSWHQKQVEVDVDKKAIKTGPRFKLPITQDDELAVFKHFARRPYWQTGHSQRDEGQPINTHRPRG